MKFGFFGLFGLIKFLCRFGRFEDDFDRHLDAVSGHRINDKILLQTLHQNFIIFSFIRLNC